MIRDDYWTEPQGDYASRCRAFLEFSAPAGSVVSQIARLELGSDAIDEGVRDVL